MKKRFAFLPCLLLCLVFTACGGTQWSYQERSAEKSCRKAAAMVADCLNQAEYASSASHWEDKKLAQTDRTRAEQLLESAGLPVLRSSEVSPEYLGQPEGLRRFLKEIRDGKNGDYSVYRVTENGKISCSRFWQRDGGSYMSYVCCDPAQKGKDRVSIVETYGIQDWDLSEKGNFYYRTFWEDDQHYANYNRIRTMQPDEMLYGMTRGYILPVGYTGVNLFLLDWDSHSMENVCINDLWDCLEGARTGQRPDPEALGFAYDRDRGCFDVPADRFEAVLLNRFPLTLEEFRQLTDYSPQTNTYPWIPLESELAILYSHAILEPEVTACRENGDGSLTLTVEVDSTDWKTDALFIHELTIRPLEDETCQYLGNKMIKVDRETLPLSLSRAEVRGNG